MDDQHYADDTLLLGLVKAHAAALDDGLPAGSGEAEEQRADSISQAIAALPAFSTAGLAAKVSVLVRDYGGMPTAADIQSLDDRQAALVASILRDVASLA